MTTGLQMSCSDLTHWGRVMHICAGKLIIIGSDNGLSPGRRQAIFWTNAGILLIGPFGTNFSEILIAIETFSFKKMHLKISSAKWRPFCLSLNVLTRMKGYQDSSPSNGCHVTCPIVVWNYLSMFFILLFDKHPLRIHTDIFFYWYWLKYLSQ